MKKIIKVIIIIFIIITVFILISVFMVGLMKWWLPS